MKTPDFESDTNVQKIMLVGDISEAFVDADVVRDVGCEVHRNMPGAIEAAANNSIKGIGVVMSGRSTQLNSALKALKEVNASAKIILLAQMWQEPTAIELVGSAFGDKAVADDYLICPTRFSQLASCIRRASADTSGVTPVLAAGQLEVAERPPVRIIDAATEMRIKKLEELATTDDLTGLKNRRYIWEFCRQIIEHAKKENGRVTLLIFDIDNFKHYNDVYGHSAGDEILKQAAVLMQRSCRPHDIIGRVGGDEFAVVFWDDPQHTPAGAQDDRRSAIVEHPKGAIFIAKRFRTELKKAELHLLGPEGKGVLTISGGLASFPRDGSTADELFIEADNALLNAKRSGKNRIYLVGKPKNDIADIE